MNGMEAKYTAKHLAKLIKHKRKTEKHNRAYFETRTEDGIYNATAMDKIAVATYLQKEINKMSLVYRAFMMHNAFKKNRAFQSAEVQYYNIGGNALVDLKTDNEKYSRYMDKFHKQQKSINIVKHTMLNTDAEKTQFDVWIAESARWEKEFASSVLKAMA